MEKVFGKKSRMLSLLIVLLLLFVTTTEGFAITAESEEEKACEKQAQIIENMTSKNLVNDDVYETKNAFIADGYSSEIIIPKEGDDVIELNDGEGETLEFRLPEEAKGTKGLLSESGMMVYNCEKDVSVAVQPLTEQVGDEQIDSVRALITISKETAPHEYDFEFDLQDGEKLVTAKEYLGADYDTGEAYVVDSDNQIVSVIDPAWAKDANRNSISTHYDVRGNSLIQIVNFDENTAFPVVADPTAWQITKCAGAIGWVVGSTVFAAAKIAKIKKYIKALGGVKKSASKLIGIIKKAKAIAKKHNTSTVKVLRRAKYSKELWEGVGKTLMNFGAAVLGIDAVVDQCSF